MKKLSIYAILLINFLSMLTYGQEICDNAIDDDNDGLIDLNDSECICNDTIILSDPSSLVPNPSFEEYSCVPTSFSELSCADDWIQASSATTDYWHIDSFFTGYYVIPGLPPNSPTDGIGFVGFHYGDLFGNNYNEYLGTCLSSTMEQDVSYTIQFDVGFGVQIIPDIVSDSITLTLFAHPDCSNLPFGTANVYDCPTNYPTWEEIGSVFVSGNNEWVEASITVTPEQDYGAIILGGGCNSNFNYGDQSYFYMDNLIVNTTSSFEAPDMDSTKIECNHYILEVPDRNVDIQWFKNGIAILGETDFLLEVIEDIEGTYTAQLYDDANFCYTTNSISLENQDVPQLLISTGSTDLVFPQYSTQDIQLITYTDNYEINWDQNDYLSCLDCLTPKYEVIDLDTLKAEIIDLENSCKASITLKINYTDVDCKIYFPNVFTPNDDGLNDVYEIYTDKCYGTIQNFSVFNRFGERVSNVSNTIVTQNKVSWNGKYKEKSLNGSVYYFVLQIAQKNGDIENYKGNLTLLK